MTRRAGSVVATAARALAPAAVSTWLAACGQKGPLVLAPPAPPVVAPAGLTSPPTVTPSALPPPASAPR